VGAKDKGGLEDRKRGGEKSKFYLEKGFPHPSRKGGEGEGVAFFHRELIKNRKVFDRRNGTN